MLLRHRGEGGRFNIGYGIAAARAFGHGNPFRFYIPSHIVPTDVVVPIPQGPWPSQALALQGGYDTLKFIDNADTQQTVYQNWENDVFEVLG